MWRMAARLDDDDIDFVPTFTKLHFKINIFILTVITKSFWMVVITVRVTQLNSMDVSRSIQDFNRVANSIYFPNYLAVWTLEVRS
jgi:hypothetical protein